MKSSRPMQAAVAAVVICALAITVNSTEANAATTASRVMAAPPSLALSNAGTSTAVVNAGLATHDNPPSRTMPVAPDLGGCPQIIDVNLTTQQLVASSCGQVAVVAPVTSGPPALRTPTGTFQVFLQEQDVYFYSPWPPGDPNYYSPMFVAYAMEFLDGGYFLHSDPDEPSSAFGAGSEDGPYASHGCVHVPILAMVALYEWADVGTTVRIHY